MRDKQKWVKTLPFPSCICHYFYISC